MPLCKAAGASKSPAGASKSVSSSDSGSPRALAAALRLRAALCAAAAVASCAAACSAAPAASSSTSTASSFSASGTVFSTTMPSSSSVRSSPKAPVARHRVARRAWGGGSLRLLGGGVCVRPPVLSECCCLQYVIQEVRAYEYLFCNLTLGWTSIVSEAHG